jgi:hypothetical protein
LSEGQIRARVLAAWERRELVRSQVDPVGVVRSRYTGVDPVSAQVIEFWLNLDTRLVETAYPVEQ